jgi:signal transduction histidine kinase
MREHLFEPFSHHHRERHGNGVGIGLAVCKRIMDLAGGEIGFKSTEGNGSTFWIELPVSEKDAAKPPRDDKTPEANSEPVVSDV